MVSQGSNCDSDEIPDYMQDVRDEQIWGEDEHLVLTDSEENGHEENLDGFVFRRFGKEEMGGTMGVVDSAHLETNPVEDERISTGVLNNPIEEVEGQDVGGVQPQLQGIHEVSKAVFTISKYEREELYALRRKMMEFQGFLARKGMTIVEVEKDIIKSKVGFNGNLQDSSRVLDERDESGLPNIQDTRSRCSISGVKDVKGVPNSQNEDIDKRNGGSKGDQKNNTKRVRTNDGLKVPISQIQGQVIGNEKGPGGRSLWRTRGIRKRGRPLYKILAQHLERS